MNSSALYKDKSSPILLVEDYPPNVLVAKTYIEDCGYNCDVATSGREAVQKAQSQNYLLILMDIQMPEMDGLEATRLIRQAEQKNNLPRLPIIAVTAHALAGDRDRCLAAGMDDYLSKPFRMQELSALLDRYAHALALALAPKPA